MSSPVQPPEPSPSRSPLPERAFSTVMRYCGLLLGMFEGLVDRPVQLPVIGLALAMMAGSKILERVVDRRG